MGQKALKVDLHRNSESDAPPFGRTAAIMRNAGHITNLGNGQSTCLNSPNGRLAPGSGPFT